MIDRVIERLIPALLLFFSTQLAAESIQIPLSGIGSLPSSSELTVKPPILAIGDIEIGSAKVQDFEITYSGGTEDTAVDIYSVEVGGEDSYDFTSDFPGSATLNNGDNVKFSVSFNPATLGDKKAFLRIEHSGGNSPHLVFLTGTGIDIPASELQISSANLDLGSIEADQNKTQTLTLTNGGGANYPSINIYNVLLSGDSADSFSTDFNNVVTISPGASITIKVTLSSGVAGNKAALLNIEHDGSNPSIKVTLEGKVTLPEPDEPDPTAPGVDPEFLTTKLKNADPNNPTSLQFGPDGKLYVAERDGYILQYTVQRTNKNTYNVTKTDDINLVQKIVNHDDDGTVNNSVKGRLVTGILVVGSANNPVIYVASGDPRMGAGPSGNDLDLDTNSVIISRLTQNGNGWSKKDIVRGLPRSEENHQGNGMQMSKDGKTLYISMGGHTNMGIPSKNFARLPEYALSAAILEIDLDEIGDTTYDVPTLDDEDRPGANDSNDPFGGNNGKNMGKLTTNGPIQVYSPGWRNAYDLLITEDNKMYTIDNGPNSGWGDTPGGNCLGDYKEKGGSTYGDNFHFISGKGYYGGHPNPTRGSKANTFNDDNPQSPIDGKANGTECQFKIPGKQDNALHVFKSSTNGFTEYTASNFGNSMKGDLLASSFDRTIYRIQLNNGGNKLNGLDKLFENLGTPLDVTAQGDNDIFPGTVWVADYGQDAIHVFEPIDY